MYMCNCCKQFFDELRGIELHSGIYSHCEECFINGCSYESDCNAYHLCQCGGDSVNTTHSHWCPKYK